jgi:hypothetical protein
MRDFSLAAYRALMEAIKKEGIPVFGVKQWLVQKPAFGIVMRHDVDRKPRNAATMAELEAEFGVRSTYYFRITPNSFNEPIIRRIASLGHEIGYHYEDLSLAGGDKEKAIALFAKHLLKLRAIAPIETIAFHGRPLSPHDNVRLWDHYRLEDYGLLAEAFLSIDYSGVYYFTDTGRTWSSQGANLRDHAKNALTADVSTTEDLIGFVRSRKNGRVAIVAHPERWDDAMPSWFVQSLKDYAINGVKRVLKAARRKKQRMDLPR